jgi:hypothetical protein
MWRGQIGRREATHDIFLHFFKRGRQQDNGKRRYGSVFIRRGDIRDLLDACRKEEKQIRILRELFYVDFSSDLKAKQSNYAPKKNFGVNVTMLYLLVET